MANSVDFDQTEGAGWSRSTLFAYGILSETFVYKIHYENMPIQIH